MRVEHTPFTCSICARVINDEWGNNPQPINGGKCWRHM